MTTTLAIAAITAVLKHLLENGLAESDVTASIGGDVIVSALPPDRATTGADERAQLNVFLYQATPNTGLRSPAAGMGRAPPRGGRRPPKRGAADRRGAALGLGLPGGRGVACGGWAGSKM